jgi:hypothetical protein
MEPHSRRAPAGCSHDRRRPLTSTVLYPSQEIRDTVLKSGVEPGATENYDRLAEMLASVQRS